MRRFSSRLTLSLILLSLLSPGAFAEQLPIITIGLVKDGASPRFDYQTTIIRQEVLDITKGEFDVRFPDDKLKIGDWNIEKIRRDVDSLLKDEEVDMVIATGPVGSQELASRPNLPKPAIASLIIDTTLQGIPFDKGSSGVKNLNYLASPKSFERDLQIFQEIVPYQNIAVLVTDTILKRLPELRQKAVDASRQYGIRFQVIAVAEYAAPSLAALSEDTDVVMITPLVRLDDQEFAKLIQGLIDKKLPSFTTHGRDEVELGAFASVAPNSDANRLGRRIALNVLSILTGEKASELPVSFSVGERLTINMATGRAIDFYPNWQILSEAEVLNEQEQSGRQLTLAGVVDEAIRVNLDLAVANQQVAVGQYDVSLARSALLPQVDSSVSSRTQSQGLANSFSPERSSSGAFRLSQILYSDEAWANLEVSGKLQEVRKLERNSVRLDIVLDTVSAYLNILKARTVLKIRKENVRRSRRNLELARVRESVGQSSRSDVYRWESEIATDRQEALAAEAQQRQTEVLLNRILNRPQEEPFDLEDSSIDDPILMISDKRFFTFVENPKKYAVFRDFMANYGLQNSPELAAFDITISAQERNIKTAQRKYWLPDFAVEGGYDNTFHRGGVGEAIPPGGDDEGWNVMLSARLPLFSGGAKSANLGQQRNDLVRLHYERRSAMEKIEARIRNTLHQVGASHASIGLAEEASKAATSNLNLITDAYKAGSISLIDLIDAQNAALSAELNAANAVYNFLLDLMEVQRAIARYDFFVSAEEREQWYQDIEDYYADALRGQIK